MKVLLTEWMGSIGTKMLEEIAEVKTLNKWFVATGIKGSEPPSEEEIINEIRDSDVVIVRNGRITRKVLDEAKKLKLVVMMHAPDKTDLSAAAEKGVYVERIGLGSFNSPVMETNFALIMALNKKLFEADKAMRTGDFWESRREKLLPPELASLTLGIIGLGRISSKLAEVANVFKMKVIAYSPHATAEQAKSLDVSLVDLPTLLKESDIVSVNCALTPEKYHLIGEKELKQMKKTAYLVNTARGPIIDESALIRALKEGWIAGAGLDVYEKEPPDKDNPLTKLDNVILTPHIAGLTNITIQESSRKVAKEVIRVLKGEFPNPEYLVK